MFQSSVQRPSRRSRSAPATIVNDHADDEDDWGEVDNLAAIVEDLGLSDDDDDEPIDIGDPETDLPPSREL